MKMSRKMLLHTLYWGSYAVFAVILILLGIFESDVEIAGFFWAGVLWISYWLVMKALIFLYKKVR